MITLGLKKYFNKSKERERERGDHELRGGNKEGAIIIIYDLWNCPERVMVSSKIYLEQNVIVF